MRKLLRFLVALVAAAALAALLGTLVPRPLWPRRLFMRLVASYFAELG